MSLRVCLLFFYFLTVLAQVMPCSGNCAGCLNGPNSCTACPQGFELNTLALCVSTQHNNCAIYSANPIFCESCMPTFRSQNGTCLKDTSGCLEFKGQNCLKCGFGKNLTKGVCIGTLNCVRYNGTVCVSCEKGYYLSRNICYSTDSQCLRIDYSTGSCIKCTDNHTLVGYKCILITKSAPKNCYLYEQKCYECKRGFVIYNGSCLTVPVCSSTHYFTPDYKCISLPIGCKNLDLANSTCGECYHNYQLVNGSCLPIPPDNCTSIDSTGNCLKCTNKTYPFNYTCKHISPYCATFTTQGKCLSCTHPDFINFGGLCKDPFCKNMTEYICLQCNNNFVFSIELSRCILVDPNCKKLTKTACMECFEGYYLSYDICKPLPDDCLIANKSGACLQCSTNYYMQFDSCFQINTIINNCRIYRQISSTPVCSVCEIGYLLSLGQCLLIPPFCNLILSNGKCVICLAGYRLVNNSCQALKGTPNNLCANMTNAGCVRCASGSVLGINGFCYQTSASKCLLSDNEGSCLSCEQGYIANRVCLSINLADVNCKSYDKSQCSQCFQGFYLGNNQCSLPNSNCSTFSSTDGGCLSCFEGFTLTNSQCVIIARIPNCLSYDGSGRCLQCSRMFFVSNNTCNNVNPLCQNYNPYSGDCTSCFPGYSLKNKICLKQNSPLWATVTNITAVCKTKRNNQCVECPFRYYLRNNVCILVSNSCDKYDSNGNCLTCNIGFFLQNRNCINYGTVKGTDQNCKLFQQESYCLECYAGFVNVKGSCESVDPLCRTYDNNTGSCTSCYEGYVINGKTCQLIGGQTLNPCLEQDAKEFCLECVLSYSLFNGSCIYNQSNANSYNIPFCIAAINATYCSLCADGFYSQSGICYQVSSYCSTYNPSTGQCITCKTGYISSGTTCIFPALGIDPFCLSYTSVYCSSCRVGYYLKNYLCSPIDPLCLNFSLQINQCLQCSKGQPNFDRCL